MKIEGFLLLLSAAFLIIVVYCVFSSSSKMFEDCLADGNKEYECYGMMYGGRR